MLIESVFELMSRFSNVLLVAFGAMDHVYDVFSVTVKMGSNGAT